MQTIPEPRFLLPESPTHVGPAFAGAGVAYAIGGLLLALLMWLRPPVPALTTAVQDICDCEPELIFRNVLGPSGGGGSGGNRTPLEPMKATPIPAIKPPEPELQPIPTDDVPPPPEPTPIAAMVPTAEPNDAPIANVGPQSAAAGPSRGTGDNGAGGPGLGGIGTGDKDGLGSNSGPNMGDGPYGPGDVDVQVVPIFTPKPAYTAEAVVRKVEGEVRLSCVVLATGVVGSCTVTRSLDGNRYGMDDEAVKAASRFMFRPATRGGKPVPVMVNIIIEFRMR